jgi:pimeloyl-ACP methyl ester carboxylesterase
MSSMPRHLRRATFWTTIVLAVVLQVVVLVASLPLLSTVGLKFLNVFPSSGGPPAAVATAQFSGYGPGSLVSATTMPWLTRTFQGRGYRAARVVYRSTNGDTGAPTVVSGSVFTPKGEAPQGGWPVVAFGHGTLGINNECGPSLSDSLAGMVTVVRVLVKLGYAVALPDYQGLGVKGTHPYLDTRTAGLNLIDAVRALRYTFDHVSDRWGAMGHSQGGGAVWAANEQARDYAPELHLVGAVAMSPTPDVSGLMDKAQQGTLTRDQRPVMQLVVESLARLHPELNRDNYRHGIAEQYWNVLSACSSGAFNRSQVTKKIGAQDFTPNAPAAADLLRGYLQQWALPQKSLSAPLSVWYGDADTYVDAAWVTDAIERACAMGGVVTVELDPDGGHNDVDIPAQVDWMADRFAGKPATNDCR